MYEIIILVLNKFTTNNQQQANTGGNEDAEKFQET